MPSAIHNGLVISSSAHHHSLTTHEAQRTQQLLRAAAGLAVLQHHSDFGLDDLAPVAAVTLDHLVRAPGVFQTDEQIVEEEDFWPVVQKALRQALTELVRMRQREGGNLEKDLERRVATMRQATTRIQRHARLDLELFLGGVRLQPDVILETAVVGEMLLRRQENSGCPAPDQERDAGGSSAEVRLDDEF